MYILLIGGEKVIVIKGKEFCSIEELEKLLGLSSMGVLCFLRSKRYRLTKYKNKVYVLKEDLEPE